MCSGKRSTPDSPRAHGIAYAGLANARPETKALGTPPANMESLPFDVFEFMNYELPWEMRSDPNIGN